MTFTDMLRETGLHASHWGVGNAVSTIDGTVQEVVDAPDAHVLGAVPIGRWRTIDAACSLAVGGLLDISRVRARDISTALSNAADAVEHHERTLAAGLVRETGKPLSEAEREVAATAAILRNYAGLGSASGTARAVWSDSGAAWGVAAPEAIGVALLVLPWNLPLMITAHKAAAALLARCSIILKPSPLAPRTPMRLAQLLSAGLPEGAVQVVQGDAETARMLISHPSTAVVSFTGASRAGRQVEVLAAESGVKSITELGGKSASIIFEDADLERAVRETFRAAMRNQGATCTAPARLLCSRTVLPEVEELMRDVQQSVVVADPYEEATTMGALRHVVADDRMAALLLDLEQASVEVSGGGRVEVEGRSGRYRSPAVVFDPPADHPVSTDELFLPIVSIRAFDDDAHAVEIANETAFGLSAGIWSRDQTRAETFARALHVGTVHINHYGRQDSLDLPSSGRGRSGFGSEGGLEGVSEYQVTKSIHFLRGQQ
ncbi:MAG: aldehyde dehydrogenase family protein [Leucobacter sp.]|uniref:aldehyde dehydrogenase family protein n=2 Tax=Agrococcus casei TaxID=343512 RepID=UPI003F8EA2EE